MDVSVSIIMITYCHEDYISKAIKGVLMQKTNFNFELIVADDFSQDNTQNIIRRFAEDNQHIVKPIFRNKNLGANENWNDAFSKCKGKYIAICEGDDFWTDPLKLQKQVDFLETNDDYGLVHTDIEYVDTSSVSIAPPNQFYRDIRERIFNGYIFDYYLNNPGFILTVSSLFRKSLLEIDACKQWFIFDHWIFMDIARKSKVYFLPEKTSAYRINPDGLMSSNQSFISIRLPNVLLDQIFRLYDKKNQNISFYLKDPKVEKNVIICLTGLLLMHLKGKLNEWAKVYSILKNNLTFIYKILINFNSN